MNREVICVVPKEEIDKIIDLTEMKNALEDLSVLIAKNNEILKQDSDLYNRIINDYRNTKTKIENFWMPYFQKYRNKIKPNEHLNLDYTSGEVYIISDSEVKELLKQHSI